VRERRPAIALVLATMMVALLATVPTASAAKATCLGQRATVVGTSGDDELTGTSGADVIAGRGGADVISGGGGNDLICGGAGNDAIFGEGGGDRVSGGDGDDQLSGGPGNDELAGGSGDDYVNYFVSQTPVAVDLAAGNATGEGKDILKTIENIFGSSFDDDLVGDDANNSIQPFGGNDRIAAGGGIDLIFDGVGPGFAGTDGDDIIDGGASLDGVSYTSSPNAVDVNLETGLAQGNGTDDVVGIEGVFGSQFDDVLQGDAGRNLFLGQGGDDHIDGGTGPEGDAAAYWFASGPVTGNLQTNSAGGLGEGTDELANIEGLLGSILFGDVLTGDAQPNYLDGDGGNDDLFGLEGNDWLVGAGGNDLLDGGPGEYDIADYSNTAFLEDIAAVQVDLAAGTATGQGSDDLTGIEGVFGSSLGDVLLGDTSTNFLFGLGGNDQLSGGAGDDFLDGGAGADDVDGGEGLDNCTAEARATSCEGDQAAVPHPVLKDARAQENFRRSF
jgi:Ca2+-binding RTX toxin-like protein